MKIDVERFLRELEILVNMDSGQGNPEGITAVGAFFAQRLAAQGWFAEQIDVGDKTGKCTVVKNREASHYDVMLVGHVDTVFPTGETARRPFRRDENRAYGLGVIDMKQGALTMLYILEQLSPKANAALSIVAIFNPDEEISSIYSRGLIESYAKISDCALVFEAASTDGFRTVQRKGLFRSRVTFHGRAGHSGYIFDGNSVSAINELIFWASLLNSLCSSETGTMVNIGKISGGEKTNIVPDFAEMAFEVRYDSMDEYNRMKEALCELEAHAGSAGVGVEYSDMRDTPPLVPSEKTLEYEARLARLGECLGVPYKSKKRGGLGDANHIAAFCPVCVDGLAPTGDFDHSEFEYLEISTVEPNLRFAHGMLEDLADMKAGEI